MKNVGEFFVFVPAIENRSKVSRSLVDGFWFFDEKNKNYFLKVHIVTGNKR